MYLLGVVADLTHIPIDLLQENITPYHAISEKSVDEELQWCFVKNEHPKKDPKFEQMYSLDKENRATILHALSQRMIILKSPEKDFVKTPEDLVEEKAISFLDVLMPININPNVTLNFVNSKLEEAGFELQLLSKVDKLPNGKNPYGLNGAIAAMIDFFYQYNYFKKEYSLKQIFKTYSTYTGNSIAKLKTFLSEFRQDNSTSALPTGRAFRCKSSCLRALLYNS